MRMRRWRLRGFRCAGRSHRDEEMLTAARYPSCMRWYLPILLLAAPALAVTPAHTGVPRLRTGPEASDIALFVMAAGGIWLVRRAMRARFARRRKD